MENIIFEKPTNKYYSGYNRMFDTICKEKKYLGSYQGFSLLNTNIFIDNARDIGAPFLFVIDKEAGEVVGWCDVQFKTKKLGKLGIGLLDKYRNQGIGKLLLEQILILAVDYGFKKIELEVRASNGRAIHVYEQVGFVIKSKKRNGFCIGNDVEDTYIMAIIL